MEQQIKLQKNVNVKHQSYWNMREICPCTMELWPSKEISLFYKYDFYYEDQTTETIESFKKL